MSIYIMSDIHGCYDDLLRMLDKIGFSDADRMILAGDYIDRGTQSYEMLKWIERCPSNIRLVRGNHEQEFADYVNLMCQLNKKENPGINAASNKDTSALYETVRYFIRHCGFSISWFDLYGTINRLLHQSHVTLDDLCRWAAHINRMPYFEKFQVRGKTCIVVHAGYSENTARISAKYSNPEQFYLYAREDSCTLGGVRDSIIIAGHTPTISKGSFSYNEGNVFVYYDPEKNCLFYDIDCGCVFRKRYPGAKLACLRLEDGEIFYV